MKIGFYKTMKFCKIKNYFLIIDAGMKMFMGKMVSSKILCKTLTVTVGLGWRIELGLLWLRFYIFQLEFTDWYAKKWIWNVIGLCWWNVCKFLCKDWVKLSSIIQSQVGLKYKKLSLSGTPGPEVVLKILKVQSNIYWSQRWLEERKKKTCLCQNIIPIFSNHFLRNNF